MLFVQLKPLQSFNKRLELIQRHLDKYLNLQDQVIVLKQFWFEIEDKLIRQQRFKFVFEMVSESDECEFFIVELGFRGLVVINIHWEFEFLFVGFFSEEVLEGVEIKGFANPLHLGW